MKITALETLQLAEFPFLFWLRVHTDAGIIGTGETFWAPGPVASYIHDNVAPYLLGKDPRDIELHDRTLGSVYVGARDSGAEVRGNSAVNIALWDIYGQALGEPLWRLLGGRTHQTRADLQHLRRLQACARDQEERAVRARRGLVAQAGRFQRGPLRGPARLALRCRRPCQEPAVRRHPRHEDLALRRRRRSLQRHAHLAARPRQGAGAVRARSATPSAATWRSWSSCTASGPCRRRCASPRR